MLTIRKSIYLFSIFLFAFSSFAIAQNHKEERILSFHADIRIDSTGEIEVSEHIEVYVIGEKIKRGIVRSLPLYRKDVFGNKVKVDFEIIKVRTGGNHAEFFTREEDGTRSIYIGRQGVLLDSGVYNYDIVYRSQGHIGFFKGYDELYWNVTGTDWIFPIDSASATLYFPAGAVPGKTSCYMGAYGANGSDCSAVVNPDHSVTFKTGKALSKREGLTIAAAFTAGIIQRPSVSDTLFYEYGKIILTVLLLLILAVYFYTSWSKYGRDPEAPVVVPDFNVPRGFSPALLRYCYKRTTDNKAFVISVINMAVKKVIRISKEEGKTELYAVEKLMDETIVLSAEEENAFRILFKTKDKIVLNSANGRVIGKAKDAHIKEISNGIELKKYFVSYSKPLLRGVLLTIAALVVFMVFVDQGPAVILFFITLLIVGGGFLFYYGVRFLRSSYGISLIMILLGGAITGGLLYFVYDHDYTFVPATIAFIWTTMAMFISYVYLIQAPTVNGAALMSEIAGFKMYLETAEQDRLNLINPPERTPELFERFLPYAMALDVENAWGAQFEALFEEIDYAPEWYVGSGLSYVALNAAFYRQFSHAVNTSVPSSGSGSSSGSSGSSSWSSGSSGGGFSGGGGGGGGGGGW